MNKVLPRVAKSTRICPRLRWQAGSLAFWVNRGLLHNPVNDDHGRRREMHRITLAGGCPMIYWVIV